jgi:hypothetical protein
LKSGNSGGADFFSQGDREGWMIESDAREQLVVYGRSSFDRGFRCGTRVT